MCLKHVLEWALSEGSIVLLLGFNSYEGNDGATWRRMIERGGLPDQTFLLFDLCDTHALSITNTVPGLKDEEKRRALT